MKQLKKLACRAVQELSITFPPKTVLSIILGTAITTFGIYNIHQQADITEGGILGLILLFHFWFGMSSSILSPVLDALSYALGFRFLGREFLKTSVFATLCMAGFFRLWELFHPVLPSLADYPLLAALAGGCFIGTGCGLVVRQGASCAGDDALALVISKVTGCRISRAYLLTDVSVKSRRNWGGPARPDRDPLEERSHTSENRATTLHASTRPERQKSRYRYG